MLFLHTISVTIDSYLNVNTITDVKELAALAHELEYHFSILHTAVLQSLVDKKVNLSDAKQRIHLSLVSNNSNIYSKSRRC